jgi:cell division protein FtsZ
MNTIKAFTAEDATVIIGNVFDENMGDKLRVTMVATGLNGAVARPQKRPELVQVARTGTDNQPFFVGASADEGAPSVFTPNSRRAQVEAMKQSGVEEYDIPAFLRKQAD